MAQSNIISVIKIFTLLRWCCNCFLNHKALNDFCVKILGRGISSYVKKPEKAGEMVKDCIENVVLKTIPHKDIKKTPIYLGATAGMRLLWYVK